MNILFVECNRLVTVCSEQADFFSEIEEPRGKPLLNVVHILAWHPFSVWCALTRSPSGLFVILPRIGTFMRVPEEREGLLAWYHRIVLQTNQVASDLGLTVFVESVQLLHFGEDPVGLSLPHFHGTIVSTPPTTPFMF